MDCILAIPEFIWNSISGSLGSLIQGIMEEPLGAATSMFLLKSREQDLRREMRALMGRHADLLDEIRRGRPENETTNEVKIWLEQVEEVRSDAEKFQIDFQWREGFSSRQLGCNVYRVLKDARRLMNERNDLTVLVPALPDSVVHWPQFSRLIGVENIRSEIYGLVEDEGSRIIGIHGMGGVGKTTLLKEINNHFFGKCSRRFDPVISVVVSNNVDIDGIQKDILTRLGYSDRDEKRRLPEGRNERKMTLCRELCRRNFLLLLDDLWKKLDLAEVGISDANKGSKIVFTTRSMAVCTYMDADQKLHVPYLNRESSWELFRLHVGTNIDELDPATTNLAKQVADKCGGLPLALVTLGKAMAGALTDYEWEAALKTLKGTAAEPVIEIEQVRNILMFSYDKLQDGHKKCLLYCSIFPEDRVTNVDELTKLWVGEGFLETSNCSFDTACTRGRKAITALKKACLLEDSHETEISKESVKLHDMVREMALWMLGLKKTIFVVDPSETLTCAKMMEKWTHATTISLMSNRISELPERPQWQNLQTLLLSGCSKLKQIPSGFFESISLLTVLDLSETKIESLPAEICSLDNLRYLNLARTILKLLPEELGKLTNLRILNLDDLRRLGRIPKEAISSLSSLQSLTMNYGSYKWKGGWKDDGGEYVGREVYLKDLDGLGQLEELQLEVSVEFDADLQGLSHCHKLCSVIRSLVLKTLGSFLSCRNQLILPVDQLTKLEKLHLEDISAESIYWLYSDEFRRKGVKCARFQNLQWLTLLRCKALRGITWIGTLPCLKYLILQECGELVEIVAVEESKMTNTDPQRDSFFPSLTTINFEGMQNLKCICKNPLLFPRLKQVWVKDCPELEKLSFELNSGPCLEYLSLHKCKKLVEIITVEESKMTNADPQKDSFFPSLTTIALEGMQNLKCICEQPLLFPGLKKVWVKDCPELEKLSFELSSAPCLEVLSLFHCNKLVEIIAVEESKMTNAGPQKGSFFSSLTTIDLKYMQNLKCLCKQPLLFPMLNKVWVTNCPKLEKLPFELTSAPCLEVLTLFHCNKLVEIIAIEEPKMTNIDPQKDSFFPSLTTIDLEGMQNLKCICKQPLLFPRLKKVWVKDCPELEKLPFELNSAPCLEVLSLFHCNKLVEIIAVEESEMTNAGPLKDSFFSSLTTIDLKYMQNVKCICKQPLLFPRLKKVYVKDCPELEKLPFKLSSAPCLKYLSLLKCKKLVEIITVEESKMTNLDPQKDTFFPSLTTINFEGMQNLNCICKRPLLFPRLKQVWVKDCPELEKLSFELNSCPCLEYLSLHKCNKLVEIIIVEESKMANTNPQKDSFFPSLTTIDLEGMQNLKCICKQPLLFPGLKKVWVKDCPELEKLSFELNSAPCLEVLSLFHCNKLVEIIEIEEPKMTNTSSLKDSFFSSLTTIDLKYMHNLKCICKQPLLFPMLKKVWVTNCPKLEKLPFELNSAPCLEVLTLFHCNKLVEIIAVEEPKMTNIDPQKDSFFPSLTTIDLEGMQNLKCICKQPLLFLGLKKVWVKDCPELEKLSFELNSAPCLEVLSLFHCNKLVEIIAVEESKITNAGPLKDSFFSSLTTIDLKYMQNLKLICKQPLLFRRLKKVCVKDCPELEKLPFELNSAPCLKYLSLLKCNKLVEIITIEESKMTNTDPQNDSFFPSLTTIHLEGMQNLKCICKQPLLFPRLNQVWVKDCPELEKRPFKLNNATHI